MATPPQYRERILGIRIGDAERGKDFRLERFHSLRVGLVLVVEAQKMQHAVHDEMRGMVGDRDALALRLPLTVSEASTMSPRGRLAWSSPKLSGRER